MAKFVLNLSELVVRMAERGCEVKGSAFIYSDVDVVCPLCQSPVPKRTPHHCAVGSDMPAAGVRIDVPQETRKRRKVSR